MIFQLGILIFVIFLCWVVYMLPHIKYGEGRHKQRGGFDTFLKVIYSEGKSGMTKASTIDGLKLAGKIIAYHCSEGWVEVRRRGKRIYHGVDRRKTNSKYYFAGF